MFTNQFPGEWLRMCRAEEMEGSTTPAQANNDAVTLEPATANPPTRSNCRRTAEQEACSADLGTAEIGPFEWPAMRTATKVMLGALLGCALASAFIAIVVMVAS